MELLKRKRDEAEKEVKEAEKAVKTAQDNKQKVEKESKKMLANADNAVQNAVKSRDQKRTKCEQAKEKHVIAEAKFKQKNGAAVVSASPATLKKEQKNQVYNIPKAA